MGNTVRLCRNGEDTAGSFKGICLFSEFAVISNAESMTDWKYLKIPSMKIRKSMVNIGGEYRKVA